MEGTKNKAAPVDEDEMRLSSIMHEDSVCVVVNSVRIKYKQPGAIGADILLTTDFQPDFRMSELAEPSIARNASCMNDDGFYMPKARFRGWINRLNQHDEGSCPL